MKAVYEKLSTVKEHLNNLIAAIPPGLYFKYHSFWKPAMSHLVCYVHWLMLLNYVKTGKLVFTVWLEQDRLASLKDVEVGIR